MYYFTVPPSNAKLEYKKYDEVSPGRVMMNCTSTGLPAPTLQWTVGNDKVSVANYLKRHL